MSATPSTTTKLKGGRSSSTHSDTLGSRRIFRPLTVDSPVLKRREPSSSRSYQTGAMCGRPSARTVANLAVRAGSAVRNARTSASLIEWYGISGARRSPGSPPVGGVGLRPGLDHGPERGRVVRILLIGELHVACV